MPQVSSTEFASNFDRYQEMAQHEPVSVTSGGKTTGYFVSAEEFEAYQRSKATHRRSRQVVDLSPTEVERIAAGRMAPEHEHLDALLDET